MQILFILLMTWMTLMGVGVGPSGATSAAADPQLQFFENFPGHLGASANALSHGEFIAHAVNIPLSLSFNIPNLLVSFTVTNGAARSLTFSLGLYSLNGSTLSLANSARVELAAAASVSQQSWYSMVTSATQNITPGTWYFGINVKTSGSTGFAIFGNSTINPGNAIPGGFLMGHRTATLTNLPASVATSDFDITGSDAIRQPYIIITA